METTAIILDKPETLSLQQIALTPPSDGDVVVDIAWSGISTGTERLLFMGRMPHFPGMGYPLVPGYESVGEVVETTPSATLAVGDTVFVPGAKCFGEVRGLFGGAASRLVVPGTRVAKLDGGLKEQAVLMALAATAYHATGGDASRQPDLIVGHGVLGRLIARIAVLSGAPAPTVWEVNPDRVGGAEGYSVVAPDDDPRRDYRTILDVSGDAKILDDLVGRLAPGGEIVLAGFYDSRLSFSFPPAFMREARFRVAAEWSPADLDAVSRLASSGALSLDGLITHRRPAEIAEDAYRTAFFDSACLKMILDWKGSA